MIISIQIRTHGMTNTHLKQPLKRSVIGGALLLIMLLIPLSADALDTKSNFRPPFALAAKEALWITGPDNTVLYQHNGDTQLVPASIFKILTAAAAMDALGSDFRFATDFYLDNSRNLVVKGFGNPVLVSEEIAQIAQILASKTEQFQDLILDGSYFERPVLIPGVSHSLNPYDASCGALNANFNTVSFKTTNGKLVSAEAQTPLLSFAQKRIKQTGHKKGRVTFSQNGEENTLYAGHLLLHFLKEAGVQQTGSIRLGKVDPNESNLVFRHVSSQTLKEVVAGMMTYSNNFTANQILLVLGGATAGPPATLEKGVAALTHYVNNQLGLSSVAIAEGSGISRKNRVSARAMDVALKGFEPHYRLLKQKGRASYKTGTLRGIQTRAGYLPSKHGGNYRFVIMFNSGRAKADQLIAAMEKQLP